MSPRTCTTVRRRLSAFVDGELDVREQLRVEAHLRDCGECAAKAEWLRGLGEAIRDEMTVPGSEFGELDGLAATVVSRVRAEREESVMGRLDKLFEDMHVVWAAVGAAGATVACVALMVGMLTYGVQVRPDSLSGVLVAMGSPGSDMNPYRSGEHLQMPTLGSEADLSPTVSEMESEAVYTLMAVINRDGRVRNIELLRADSVDRRTVIDALDTISHARFQPARYADSPVAVNVVWMLAHLTVRGKMPEQPRPVPGRTVTISERMLAFSSIAA